METRRQGDTEHRWGAPLLVTLSPLHLVTRSRPSLQRPQPPDASEQWQVGRADVAADAALDAGVETVAVGEAEVVILGGVEQAGRVDAHGAALDAPAATDARVGVH